MPLESKFKSNLIKKIKTMYPGAIILKNNANQIQGFPDNIILEGSRWAVFDAKKDESSPRQPNQEYWIHLLNEMSFAAFVYPQNEERFLYELQQAFRAGGGPRFSIRK